MYDKPRPITVDTVIPPPPPEPWPSIISSTIPNDGYFKPRDTLNQDVIKSAEPVKRVSSMQTPRQLLLAPAQSRENSWPCITDKPPKSPTIVISPPSEENLPPIPISGSPLSKHRRSMFKAICVAFFVICTVAGLIFLFLFSS